MAPTGHTAAHCPHCTHTTSERSLREGRADDRVEPASLREDGGHPLGLAAHRDAAAAGDALGRVPHEGRACSRPSCACSSCP